MVEKRREPLMQSIKTHCLNLTSCPCSHTTSEELKYQIIKVCATEPNPINGVYYPAHSNHTAFLHKVK